MPPGVCQNAEDRVENDPQLAELNWLTEVTGTKIGTWPIAEVPVKMSATPPHIGGMIDRGAPGYGEDNEYVLGEILGYTTGRSSSSARTASSDPRSDPRPAGPVAVAAGPAAVRYRSHSEHDRSAKD